MTETDKPQLDHDNNGAAGGSLPAAERGLDALRSEAESLGIKVDQRWGAARLQQEIDIALEASPEPDRPRTLHELNMEQRAIDRHIKGVNLEAANAVRDATLDVLDSRRPDGRRYQKPVRAPITGSGSNG